MKMYHEHNHEHHHHYHQSKDDKLDLIISKLNQIMANEQQFRDALTRIETATTAGATATVAVQARIDALVALIPTLGLSADVEASLLAQIEGVAPNLEALAASLTAMGQNPTTPVPVPVPDPVTPVEPTPEG